MPRKMCSIRSAYCKRKRRRFGIVSSIGDAQCGVPGEFRSIHPAIGGGPIDGFPLAIREADRSGAAGFAAIFLQLGAGFWRV